MARRGPPALAAAPSVKAHLVLMPIPAWGHVRPLCALVARVVQMRPVAVTFLIAGDNVARVKAEISQYFVTPEHRKLFAHIRVVGLGSLVPLAVPVAHIYAMGSIADTFQQIYQDMLHALPVTCAWTGDVLPAFPKPTLVILDVCSVFATDRARSVSGNTIPILAWVATPASSLIRLFGDESRGGIGDLEARIRERAEETGRRPEDVSGEVFRDCDGSTVRIPGLSDHYDYELFPQEPVSPSRIPWVIHKGYRSLQACDGAIALTSEVYEPETTRAVREWFVEEGKEFFAPGPLTVPLSAGLEDPKSEICISKQNLEVQELLDNAFEKHGRHSLIYIAFGSVFWPKESDHVWDFVYTLLDLGIPFIMSHASLPTLIPTDIAQRVKESGIGLLLPWSPQQMILAHPATGWFLTHCGANSILEALYHGVPMICWPQEGDQPANAIYVSTNLLVGFELFQVRTGLGMRKMHRNGTAPLGTREAVRGEFREVLAQARGKAGSCRRANAQKMQKRLRAAWELGGASRNTLERFVETFIP